MNITHEGIHIAVITAAAVGAATLAGCLPLPPLISTPKIALYYQEYSSPPSADATSIKRWLPETAATETLLQLPTALGAYDLGLVQPYGSNFLIHYSGSSIAATYLSVPDSDNPKPRLLNAAYDTDDDFYIAYWTDWAPDGKHIAIQVNRSVIVTAADGSNRRVIDSLDNFSRAYTGISWSPDGSRLAYINAFNIVEVVDIGSGEKNSFSMPDPDFQILSSLRWMADNRHIVLDAWSDEGNHTFIFDVQDPTSIREKILGDNCCWISQYWSPQGDRTVQSLIKDEIQYKLIFLDNRADVPLFTAPLNDYPTLRDYTPSWSQDGEKLSYVTDVDTDGSADVIIASKDGVILQTFLNIGAASVAAFEWSPDNSKLLVVTIAPAADGETLQGRLITLSTATIVPLSTLDANPEISFVSIDWSPNSRYVSFHVEPHDQDTGDPLTGPSLLFDTENPDAKAIPLFAEQTSWSPDSHYLAIATLNDTEDRRYSISVLAIAEGSRTAITLAKNAGGSIQWSNPGVQ